MQILDGSISGLGSMIIHMLILMLVVLWQSHSGGGAGEGLTNDVLIGVLPSEQLTDQQEERVSADEVKQSKTADHAEEMVEVEPVTSAAEASSATADLAAATPSPSGGQTGGFDLGTTQIGGGSMAGGGGNWDGTLVNSPAWVVGRIENGVSLDGADDFVTLPTGVVDGLTDYTIATWVQLGSNSNWSRIFDFGSGIDTYMFLTPANGTDADLRFTIKAGGVEQQINTSSKVPTRGWAHLAVAWTNDVGILVAKTRAVGYRGPFGFQGFGIKMDSKELLKETMVGWKKISR